MNKNKSTEKLPNYLKKEKSDIKN